jgi:RimJ/RimL family protein N-acetyltransferase
MGYHLPLSRQASAVTDFLKTPRLVLRRPRETDLLPLASLLNNWRISKNLGRVPYPYALDDAHRWLAFSQTIHTRSRMFAITLAGAIIGVIGYEIEESAEAAEVGYWLAEPFWGNGFMREAAGAVVSHAFMNAKYDRLFARYQHANEASRRVLVGLGFRHIGHGRSFSAAQRRTVDVGFVELTRKEWLRERQGDGR